MTAATSIHLRLSARDLKRVERAASLTGLPLAIFAHTAALKEADRTFAEQLAVRVSAAESKRFLAAIGKPFDRNAALRRAMKRGEEVSS